MTDLNTKRLLEKKMKLVGKLIVADNIANAISREIQNIDKELAKEVK